MFLELQILALQWVDSYQLVILVHVEERSQNFEKRLLVSLCLSVSPSARSNWSSVGRIFMKFISEYLSEIYRENSSFINPYPTAFPYGNGMVLHFYQQQESSTTKTVHIVINKGLKTYVLSPHTVRISINL